MDFFKFLIFRKIVLPVKKYFLAESKLYFVNFHYLIPPPPPSDFCNEGLERFENKYTNYLNKNRK